MEQVVKIVVPFAGLALMGFRYLLKKNASVAKGPTAWVRGFLVHYASRLFSQKYAERWIASAYLRKVLPTTAILRISTSIPIPLQIDEVYTPLQLRSSGVLDETLLQRSGSILISGDPGCGKSSLLQFLLRRMCQDGLRAKHSSTRLPLLIELKDLPIEEEDVLDSTAAWNRINSYFCKEYVDHLNVYRAHGCLGSSAASSGIVLMLDGFDEVSEANRTRTARFIKKVKHALETRGDTNLLVLTTRQQALDTLDYSLAEDFDALETLADFSDAGVYSFLLRWPYRDHSGQSRAREVNAGRLYSHLEANPNLLEACHNPLALSLFVALTEAQGLSEEERTAQTADYPETRAAFYRKLTELLLVRRRYEQGLQGGSLSALHRLRSDVLESIAEEHALSDDPLNRIRIETCIEVSRTLRLFKDDEEPEKAFERLCTDTGVMERVDQETFRFVSQPFLDFFVGKALSSTRYNRAINRVCRLAVSKPLRFEQPLLIAVGLLSESAALQEQYLKEIASTNRALLPVACMEAQLYEGVGFSNELRRMFASWVSTQPDVQTVKMVARVIGDNERVSRSLGRTPKVRLPDLLVALETAFGSREEGVRVLASADMKTASEVPGYLGKLLEGDVSALIRACVAGHSQPELIGLALDDSQTIPWAKVVSEAALRSSLLAHELGRVTTQPTTATPWTRSWAVANTMYGQILERALETETDSSNYPHLSLLHQVGRPARWKFTDATRSAFHNPLALVMTAFFAATASVGLFAPGGLPTTDALRWPFTLVLLLGFCLSVLEIINSAHPAMDRVVNLDPIQSPGRKTVEFWFSQADAQRLSVFRPRPAVGDCVVAYERLFFVWRRLTSRSRLSPVVAAEMRQWHTEELRSFATGQTVYPE